MSLPEARLAEPREGARKGGIVPAARNPRRVVQDAQAAQRLDQRELGEVELPKQLVTFHQRRPARLLTRRVTGQEHPQVLDARTRHAIVEIHEQRAALAPQDVAAVAIAVDAHARQRSERLKTLSDPSDDLLADPRVLVD